MSTVSISAVVINYNSGHRLEQAVRAVESQTIDLDEIIIVDNASSDGSADGLSRSHIRIVRTASNLGAAAARNIGLKEAASDLVFMMDADMIPDAGCAASLLEGLNTYAAQVCVPRIILEPQKDIVQMDGADTHYLGLMTLRNADCPVATTPPEERVARTAPSGCYLLHRDAALAAGGFCEFFFFYFEDLEFGYRLSLLGQRIVFSGFAVAGHDRGDGTPGLSFRGAGEYPKRRAYLTLRNRLLVIASLYQARTIIFLSPVLLAFEIITFIGCVLQGWSGEWWRAWAWLFQHRREWLNHRRWVQSRRKVSDRELLSGGPVPFARGFLNSSWQQAVARALSAVLGAYWTVAKKLI